MRAVPVSHWSDHATAMYRKTTQPNMFLLRWQAPPPACSLSSENRLSGTSATKVAYTTNVAYYLRMFERCLYFNVNALARAVNRIWDEAFSEFDLSPSHAYLLRLVLAEPGLTPKQIGQELKLEKSTITRFLNVLDQRKLISRKAGRSGDAREQGIYPTQKAQKIAARLEAKGNELYEHMIDNIGKTRLVELVGELRKTESQLDQS